MFLWFSFISTLKSFMCCSWWWDHKN